jgi:hypothetical protein
MNYHAANVVAITFPLAFVAVANPLFPNCRWKECQHKMVLEAFSKRKRKVKRASSLPQIPATGALVTA